MTDGESGFYWDENRNEYCLVLEKNDSGEFTIQYSNDVKPRKLKEDETGYLSFIADLSSYNVKPIMNNLERKLDFFKKWLKKLKKLESLNKKDLKK